MYFECLYKFSVTLPYEAQTFKTFFDYSQAHLKKTLCTLLSLGANASPAYPRQ